MQPNARKPIFEVPFFTAIGAGTSFRAFSNLRDNRSITAWYSSGFSVYPAASLCPDPRVKYAALGWSVPGRVRQPIASPSTSR